MHLFQASPAGTFHRFPLRILLGFTLAFRAVTGHPTLVVITVLGIAACSSDTVAPVQTADASATGGAGAAGAGGTGSGGADGVGGAAGAGGNDSGGADDGDTAQDAAPPCSPGSGFTACVKACGEADQKEKEAAACVAGRYQCSGQLIPAVTCPPASWPSGPFAGCGPWVEGYDCGCASPCTCPATCTNGLWTCELSCPDAGHDGP
jgi:hypothetical protein